ncbi:hypothetical protein [Neorhizobium sp. DAR64861/K0K2]|uniref:hypothetical protein n=1 Tax=unclassified Neorhizobium TaxID=2629175 RepID=UPI003D295969
MLANLKAESFEKSLSDGSTIFVKIGFAMRHYWWRYHCWNSKRIALLSLCDSAERMLKDIGITRPLLELSIDWGLSQATSALQKRACKHYGCVLGTRRPGYSESYIVRSAFDRTFTDSACGWFGPKLSSSTI